MHPLAQHLQAQGRGNDTVLVHMTPRELGGLQALARAHGGTLTTNPKTGLPEAGFLDSILPVIAGIGLNFLLPGSGLLVPLLVGGADAAITGDLGKGLMAGLGAYGGASLGGALGLGGAAAAAPAADAGASTSGGFLSNLFGGGAASAAAPAAAPAADAGASTSGGFLSNLFGGGAAPAAADAAPIAPATTAAPAAAAPSSVLNPGDYFASSPQLGADIGTAPVGTVTAPAIPDYVPSQVDLAKMAQTPELPGLPAAKGLGGLSTMQMAGIGLPLLMAANSNAPGATTPTTPQSNYKGPYVYPNRTVSFPTNQQVLGNQTAGWQYFSPTSQFPGYVPAADAGYTVPSYMQMAAKGGQIKGLHAPLSKERTSLPDGSFVMDARSVSEIGNGSSSAGAQILRKIGGQHLHGPGDGVSDSIPAKVDAHTDARVARDEVKFSPEAVKRLGGGDEKKGASKLYHLMHKAGEARRHAARGGDTKLRGLFAIK